MSIDKVQCIRASVDCQSSSSSNGESEEMLGKHGKRSLVGWLIETRNALPASSIRPKDIFNPPPCAMETTCYSA
ncbi:unnamed protein product [Anisakis simplex]|uniref:Uncharacterized protein n=1 Tax=Anisakis simplex TaxID=6269 RepID=A0A0M3J4N0_ANISI|nr:unnamed protein product [Anisakis simplex]